MAATARLTADPIAPDTELAAVIAASAGQGAVVSFTGIARPTDADGGAVAGLFLDHYPGMTEASLEDIADAGLARFDVAAVHIVHRCGSVRPGETIVFVAAASRHRRAAFEAADYLMDRLKTEALFWKREQAVDGARWIEPTDRDHRDAIRWNSPCPE